VHSTGEIRGKREKEKGRLHFHKTIDRGEEKKKKRVGPAAGFPVCGPKKPAEKGREERGTLVIGRLCTLPGRATKEKKGGGRQPSEKQKGKGEKGRSPPSGLSASTLKGGEMEKGNLTRSTGGQGKKEEA